MHENIESLVNRDKSEIHDLISIIQEGIKSITKNAKYGSYINFYEDLSRIKIAISKLDSKVGTIPTKSVKHKKILVPYDGSPFSKRALDEAQRMAKIYGSTIYLASVIDISNVLPIGQILSKHRRPLEQIRSSVKLSTELVLQKIKKEYVEQGIDVEKNILVGSPIEELLKFIKQNNIDLVVIGSKGLSGLSKIRALGSVSRRISELSTCPVMIVR